MEKRSFKNNKIDSSNTNKAAESDTIDSVILEVIKNFVEPPQYSLTLDKIRLKINDVAGISINKRKVKEVLKSSLNYIQNGILGI